MSITEHTNPRAGAPWHLWAVGGVTLLWNGFGACDYILTETQNAAYFAALGVTPEMAAYYAALPVWHVAVWAIGVWGALLGSICLLLRRDWAVWLFAVSLAGIVLGSLLPLLDAQTRAMGGAVGLFMAATVFVVGALELVYALAMKKRGVLR